MSTQSTSLNEELSAIEAVVNEYEEKINDGRHSVENLKKQIEAIADANEVMAKMNAGDNEWLDKWKKKSTQLSGIDKINILRLSELKYQYPNESRIFKLGNRAVKCFLKLCEINCTVTEKMGTPDLRPQIEASNREIMAGLRKMYSNMFTDSPFVPSSQSHFADAFGVTTKQKIEDIRRNTKAKNNSSSSDNIQLISKKGLFITIFIALGAIGAALVLYFLPTQANNSESDNNPMPEIEIYKSFTDPRDGKTYKTVTIGEQTWMAENLDYMVTGSKCYGDNLANCNKYGRLYDWNAAMKACPPGWHLPSNAEWDALYRTIDGTSGKENPYKSETAGKYLKAKSGWNSYNEKSGNGEDNYGFAALPGGLGNSSGGFSSLGNYGNWWSSTKYDGTRAYNRFKSYKHDNAGWETETKSKLFSVRCLQD